MTSAVTGLSAQDYTPMATLISRLLVAGSFPVPFNCYVESALVLIALPLLLMKLDGVKCHLSKRLLYLLSIICSVMPPEEV
jgi:hypothetical protein